MAFFQPPPQTRYDIVFHLGQIPVQVHPLFWIMALLLGLYSGGFLNLVVWVVVVFIAILVHELGHALVLGMYGQPAYIVLYHFGGLTIPMPSRWGGRSDAISLSSNQEMIVSLAGPFAGFTLATIISVIVTVVGGVVSINWLFGFIPIPLVFLPGGHWLVRSFVSTFLWVSIFWGMINLLPVYPLDGGNVARHLFLKVDPWEGVRKSLWLSVISGALVALVGLILLKSFYMALLFGILAAQSYQAIQGRRGPLI
jgi:membrane-associated protease RseP (regulator of RpoE activity)